ncbi:MAG TPA: Na+/H+ antiporter NhaC [Longimicrobiales bacterium]
MSATRRHAPLTLVEAILPIATMVVLFGAGAAFMGASAELLIVVLLGSAATAGFVAARHGCTWDDIQRSTGEKLASVLPVVLILLVIGALIAAWMLSGTIPYLVAWGIRLVRPAYLVPTAFLATAMMSLCTGTSWGSAGTIGVALMGTAVALDAPIAATAGAVLSGAYFGDKVSPLSDSTNICALAVDAPLYRHIRHLMYTSLPSFTLALVVYLLMALLAPVSARDLPASAHSLLADLEAVYSLHWIALVPPAVVIACMARRVPPALAIALSAIVAAVIGVAFQSFSVQDAVIATVSGFRTEMVASTGADPAALGAQFRTLVERGGLYGMGNTLIVIISAFVLAAAMDVSGSLNLLIERMLAAVDSVFGLIAATMAAGATMIGLTSHGGVTALVIGALFKSAYTDRGLSPVNLSRTIEDSVTITEPLMPWTVSAVFMASTLGVPTLEYAPWAVFCYGGPACSLLIAALYRRTGFGIRPLAKDLATAAAVAPDLAGGAPESAPEGVPAGGAGGAPEGAGGRVPTGGTGGGSGAPEGAPEGVPSGGAGGAPEGAPGEVPAGGAGGA